MESAAFSHYRVLASGAVVEVDTAGRTEFLTCSWLVEVATGCPEPDFPEDTYRIEPCGGRVYSLDGSADLDHTRCQFGHERHAYGSAEWQEQDLAAWAAERREAGIPA